MKNSATLVGLVVLGVVGAGVWWVRPPSPSAGHLPTASARQGERDGALPDVTLAGGSVNSGDVRITLLLTPQPPVAFAKTRVRVRTEVNGSPAVLEGGSVSFEMTMPMGDHRYTLVPGEAGWQEAAVVLPT